MLIFTAESAELAEWFGDETPLAVEIRHASWLRREPMTFLHEHGLGFVNIDLPQGRGSPPPTAFATSDTGYVRLHGRNSAAWFSKGAGRDQKYDYRYSPEEVKEVVRRVQTVRGKTLVTYVVTNNHFRGQAPANALEIILRDLIIGTAQSADIAFQLLNFLLQVDLLLQQI